jgi:hypothetical protein
MTVRTTFLLTTIVAVSLSHDCRDNRPWCARSKAPVFPT